jgi:hypothetical protein
MPQATSRSHNWDNTSCGSGADRAPPISQSAIALMFGLGIGLELIGFVSRRILQAGAFAEQPYAIELTPFIRRSAPR